MNYITASLLPIIATCATFAQANAYRLNEVNQFNINPNTADITLIEFAQQSNVTVIVPYDYVAGVETPGIRGSFSAIEAAMALIEGTGLKISVNNNGKLLIRATNSMGNQDMLQKNKLSSAVIMAISSLSGAQSIAQETDVLEEVLVTGIRGSLERAMDIKRDSSGIVDAISAEDIGKFPDTNLAESLQRITGVSISRENGEGSKVTVRGFGDDYNMITLNGRTMPAADAPRDGAAAGRGFDFAQLASEVVSGVEVYKTGRANIASGGIGATINLKTARPLDNPGLNMSFGVKGVHDTTNRVGDDITPEVSAISSWTNESDTFGIGIALSHQERDSGSSGATSGWNVRKWADHETNPDIAMPISIDAETGERNITNEPKVGQLYATPINTAYSMKDAERTRTNGQIVFQYEPMDELSATVDYTFAEHEEDSSRYEQGIWYLQSADRAVFDTDEPVATPIIYSEFVSDTSGKDTSVGFYGQHQTNELKSLGLNLNYQVNDSFSLEFDAHDSSADSLPTAPWGGSYAQVAVGSRVVGHQVVDHSGDLPVYVIDDIADCGPSMNCDNQYTIDDVGSQAAVLFYSLQSTDITQVRFNGKWDFDDGSIEFGLEDRSVDNQTLFSSRTQTLGDWGIANPGDIPQELLTPTSFVSQFDDFSPYSPELGRATDRAWTANISEVGRWAENAYGIEFEPSDTLNTHRSITEDIAAAYFQVDLTGDIGQFPFRILTGARYEETEVTSVADLAIPSSITWQSNNDFLVNYGESQPFARKSKYDHILPSLDFSLDLSDDLVTRVSYSKTIARPTYNHLSSAIQVAAPSRPTTEGFIAATAAAGNPDLVPLESNNFDFSLEWYYGESSYTSAGFFEKRVDNFIGTEPIDQPHFGLRDATSGPRAQTAREALESRADHDGVVDETELFTMVVAMENGLDYDTLNPDEVEINYDVAPNSDDPLYQFTTNTPVNNKSARIHGFELASQHFFGTSGFGLQANYTIVRGDISFDNTLDPSITQFALLGLSDTANLVLLYEKHGLSARLAYNWRDEYLASTNTGGNNPSWVEEYSQIDMNVSYDISDDIQIFFEGINLTGEDSRVHGRSPRQVWNLQELGARYQVGARYTF